jgi:DNA-binding transcriptional LysR family regulator
MAVVVAVGEAGSLSAAARRLGMPLPTVSRKISDLETHLSARLFNRSTRRLALTDVGRVYLRTCKQILEDVSSAEQAATGEFSAPKGDLVISAPIVFGRLHVLPVIVEFLKEFPAVNVRLALGDRMIDLLEDHIDLAIRIGALVDSSLVATRCGSVRRVVCASPSYLAAHPAPKRPADLATHATVVFDGLTSADAWIFKGARSDISVPIQPKLIVNTAEAAIDAAIAGVGLTRVLSYQGVSAVSTGELVTVLRQFEPVPLPVSIVYSNQRRLPLKVRAFLDFAAPRLRTRLTR